MCRQKKKQNVRGLNWLGYFVANLIDFKHYPELREVSMSKLQQTYFHKPWVLASYLSDIYLKSAQKQLSYKFSGPISTVVTQIW